MEENQPVTTTSSNSKMPLIMVLVFIALILLGGGAWFVMNSSNSQKTTVVPTAIPTQVTTEVTNTATPTSEASPSGEAVMTDKTVKEFTVEGSSFKFTPNKITVKKGDTVKVNFKSIGAMPHDFAIDEFNVATKQISGGATESVTFVADKAGTFEFYCSVGNHRAQGMVGTLVVTP